LERLFARLFDEGEFLSPYGLRALSAYHRDHPYTLDLDGVGATIDYEPAESTTAMFGGNSNWRGARPVPLHQPVVRHTQALPPLLGRRTHAGVPGGLRAPPAAGRHRARPAGPADLDLPRRPRRPPAVLRVGGAPAE